MDPRGLRELAQRQCDVLSRRQLIAHGVTDNDIARLVRQRRLARVANGIFVTHTGPLTRTQQEWAALLRYEPAALTGVSALASWKVRGPWIQGRDPRVHLVVDGSRRPDKTVGVVLDRSDHFSRIARLDLAPPRVELESAALDAASCASDDSGRVAILSDVCQQRRTTVSRLFDALGLLPRLPHRAFISELLLDVEEGAYSVLERRYLREVERAHGMPRPERQRGVTGGSGPGRRGNAWRDVDYEAFRFVVELDGRLGHEWTTDRWSDMDRDVATATRLEMTMRVGWGQMLEPCRLATGIGTILVARGWSGWLTRCGPGCLVPERVELGGSPAWGA